MSIILTEKQEEGLELALQRYDKRAKYTVISGYAGTGKSTLVRFIIDAMGVDPENDVVYATYTGKAAQVLINKGCKNAMTLHRLLYESIPRPDGTFYRRIKTEIGYDIVVVDEVSMVPKSMIELLLAHNVHVIFLGDPFQLPPIDKDSDNHLLDYPHIFLDEIMRQEMDSEIIRLTLDIREGKPIEYYKGSEIQIITRDELSTGMLLWADQILTATNKTRVMINDEMRQLLNKEGLPQEGDKVICLRNYWDFISDTGDYLVNGTIGYLDKVYQSFNVIPRWAGGGRVDTTNGIFTSDVGCNYGELQMDTKEIITGERTLSNRTVYKLSSNRRYANLVPLDFTYGYAITCHKAQGSEWDKVLVFEEKFPFDSEEHARWLYTACTRSVKKLVLIR